MGTACMPSLFFCFFKTYVMSQKEGSTNRRYDKPGCEAHIYDRKHNFVHF